MFAQLLIFLAATVCISATDIKTIHQEDHERNCADFLCPIGAFNRGHVAHNSQENEIEEEDEYEEVCLACEDCTNDGYSVCAQYRESNHLKLRAKRLATHHHSNNCACSSSVPDGCRLTKPNEPKDPSMDLVHICYMRTILMPPMPHAAFDIDKKNGNKIIIATLEAFWLDSYWEQFKLSNLTLYYQFSLTTPEYCGEELKTIEGANGPEHICTGTLTMDMSDTPGDESIPDGTNGEYDDPANETLSTEEEYEDGIGPEVQFERDVFGDAKNVRLWYTVNVHRHRQLNLAKLEDPVEDIDTPLSSPTLDFSLKEGQEKEDKEHKDHKEAKEKVVAKTKSGTDSYEYNEEEEDKKSEEKAKSKAVDEDLEDQDEEKTKEKEEDEPKEGDESSEKHHEEDTEKSEGKEDPEEKEDEKSQEEKPEEAEDVDPSEDSKSEEVIETSLLDSNETDSNSTDVKSSSFFDNYLNNAGQWPMLKIGLIVTILCCTMLFLIGCCCYHKDCCCYADRKKVTTKSANGYQYHMTSNGQNGQEMKPLTKAMQNGLKESGNSTLQRNRSKKSEENPLDILEKALNSTLDGYEPPGNEIHGELTKLLIPEDSIDAHQFRDLLETAPQLWPKRLRVDAIVGNGHFGVINRGLLIDSEKGDASEVTISSVRKLQNLHEKEVKALMIVLSDAVKARDHPNIISLLAVQQQPDRLLVVTDSLFYPDLLALLRESRIVKFDTNLQKRVGSMLTSERLMGMMNDVISGTGHLIKNGIAHPMLAACNVLVAGGALKISGFGFATHRHLHSRQFEPRPTKQRWQSPESFLSDLVPVQPGQSMIWSLGVLLWEIISLGGTPYANIPTPEAFSSLIREQKARLTTPSYVSPEIGQIIELCCEYDREKRPDMTDVIARKMELISITPDIHINLTMDHDNFPYLPVLPNLEHIVAKI